MMNRPVWSVENLLPKNKFELAAIAEEQQKEEKRVAAMEPRERRRYEAEKKRKAKIEADLEPEKLLRDQMELTKRHIASVQPGGDFIFERIRGLITVEDGDTTQDYQLIVNANEIAVKPLKNQNERLSPQDLGLMIYGRNIADNHEKMARDLLKTCRQ